MNFPMTHSIQKINNMNGEENLACIDLEEAYNRANCKIM